MFRASVPSESQSRLGLSCRIVRRTACGPETAVPEPRWRWTVEALLFAGVALCGMFFSVVIIPWASSGPLKDFALKNNDGLREEIGWDDLVRAVGDVRDGLTASRNKISE